MREQIQSALPGNVSLWGHSPLKRFDRQQDTSVQVVASITRDTSLSTHLLSEHVPCSLFGLRLLRFRPLSIRQRNLLLSLSFLCSFTGGLLGFHRLFTSYFSLALGNLCVLEGYIGSFPLLICFGGSSVSECLLFRSFNRLALRLSRGECRRVYLLPNHEERRHHHYHEEHNG